MTNSTTEPTQSIRERVARALFDHDVAVLLSVGSREHEQWPTASIGRRQSYYDQIDAILSELMEPSAEMIGEAGAKVLNKYVHAAPADSYLGTAEWALECWQAMLQHIRSGGK